MSLRRNIQNILLPAAVMLLLGIGWAAPGRAQAAAEKGNPASLSDAGVAASMARAAAYGAYSNVIINLAGIEDEKWRDEVRAKADKSLAEAKRKAEEEKFAAEKAAAEPEEAKAEEVTTKAKAETEPATAQKAETEAKKKTAKRDVSAEDGAKTAKASPTSDKTSPPRRAAGDRKTVGGTDDEKPARGRTGAAPGKKGRVDRTPPPPKRAEPARRGEEGAG